MYISNIALQSMSTTAQLHVFATLGGVGVASLFCLLLIYYALSQVKSPTKFGRACQGICKFMFNSLLGSILNIGLILLCLIGVPLFVAPWL